MALQENLNNVRVLIHSAIRIQTEDGTVVYADPYDLVEEPHDADVVLVTHGHYDHFCAVPGLKEHYPEIQLMAAEKEVPLLRDPRKNYSASAIGAPVTLQPDRLLKEGDKIELDELEFTVWETPGHTAGWLTYFCGDAIFTGDTLFVLSCGRTDMYSSDFMDMVDSLTRLRSIKTNYHMYPGHEQDGMLFDQYTWIDSLVARVRAAYGR